MASKKPQVFLSMQPTGHPRIEIDGDLSSEGYQGSDMIYRTTTTNDDQKAMAVLNSVSLFIAIQIQSVRFLKFAKVPSSLFYRSCLILGDPLMIDRHRSLFWDDR